MLDQVLGEVADAEAALDGSGLTLADLTGEGPVPGSRLGRAQRPRFRADAPCADAMEQD